MSEASSSPKRPRLDYDDSNSKDEPYEKFKIRDVDEGSSVSHSKSRKRQAEIDEDEGKEEDSKSKSANREATPREHTLVMRLTNKEQELQECMNQIQEMKQAQTQKTAHLRSMLLDPAINLVFQRMAKEMDEHKEKLKQKQNELSAWKFTPDSQTGMRLMAKCRMLLQENGDLGKMISSGRTARLEGEIALHKALVTEMKKNQKELDEFVGELEEDVEGMQGMIFMLQEQLKEAREQIARLQQENEQLRTLQMPPDPEPGGDADSEWASATPSDPHSTSSQLASDSHQELEKGSAAALSGLARTTMGGLSHAQSSEEEFVSCGAFVSKVTPDSGVQTQEEEEVSMDTSDFAKSPGSQDVATPLSQSPVAPSDRTSSSQVASSRHTAEALVTDSKVCNSAEDAQSIAAASRTSVIEKSSSPCDVTSRQKASPSVPDSSSSNLSPSAVSSRLDSQQRDPLSNSNRPASSTAACEEARTPPAIVCSSNGDSSRGVDSLKRTLESGRNNHTSDGHAKDNGNSSDSELTEGIADRKQSVLHHPSSIENVEEGKDKEELTDSTAQHNLVNGSSSL